LNEVTISTEAIVLMLDRHAVVHDAQLHDSTDVYSETRSEEALLEGTLPGMSIIRP